MPRLYPEGRTAAGLPSSPVDASVMPKRSSKQKLPRDVNRRTKSIVDLATSEAAPKPETTDDGTRQPWFLGGLAG
jgi:hypothetical protein